MNANAQYAKPDFAYPKTVSKNAMESLEKALNDGDGKKLVRSLINYSLAECAIDNDSLQPVLDKIADITSSEKDAATRSLLYLMQADIYNSIYTRNRWNYDRRELPSSDHGNYQLWSGEQFCEKIRQLTADALSSPEQLLGHKLSEYKGIVKYDDDAMPFFPTLYDFVAWRSIDILKWLQQKEWVFPASVLCRYDRYSHMSFNYRQPIARQILDIYRQLIDFHKNDPAALIYTDISRIEFIGSGVDNSEKEQCTLLYDLYNQYSSSPYSTEAMIAIGDKSYYYNIENYPEEVNTFYRMANECLRRHPGYFRAACLKNRLANITDRKLNLEYQSTVVPGDTLLITVSNNNVNNAKIEIYKVPYSRSADYRSYDLKKGNATLVKTLHIKNDLKAPFFSKTTEKTVLPGEGAYIIVPVIEGKRNDRYNSSGDTYDYVHCTSLNLSTGAYGAERWAYVTNPKTGEPVKHGVTITVSENNNRNTRNITADTTAMTKITGKGNYLYATKGTDRFSQPCYLPYSSPATQRGGYAIQGNTDLAIYHPGDTVRWSAVVQQYGYGKATAVVPGFVVEVAMRDANYEVKDTVLVTSDDFGRINGSFRIPEEGLTGNYSLVFTHPQDNAGRNNYGYTQFMVSDYKLPTYEVEITDILRDCPAKGDVTLKGKTETYSGFPLAGCRIVAELKASPRYRFWWGSSNGEQFYTTTLSTDESGTFSICFPAQLLEESPVTNGIFTANLTATSPTGENRQASRNFTTGKPYILSASLPSSIDIDGNVDLDVTLADLNGKPVAAKILYRFIDRDSNTVAEGSFMSDRRIVDLAKVPSGVYSVEFATADPELAEKMTVANVTLYRDNDTTCPVKDAILWIPRHDYTIGGRETDILYGTTGDTQYIRYSVYSDSTVIEQGWKKVKAGMNRFTYRLPDGIEKIHVNLTTCHDYTYQSADINVTTESSLRGINLSVESFRDRIVPGTEEKWTFKVSDRDSLGVKSAIILDMYSKALDAIRPHALSLSPRSVPPTVFRYNFSGFDNLYSSDITGVKGDNCRYVSSPSFELWGQSWTNIRIRGYMAKSAGMGMLNSVTFSAKEASDEAVFVTGALDGGESDAEEEKSMSTEKSMDNFQYRAAETPLAFFRPELTTDSDGNLSFSFTAPDANTTWQLRGLAFTKDMLVSNLSREILSNKPVMVQPNMPRFLRTGDKAVIEASVMNNSDSAATVTTTVQLFDPFSGKVTATYPYETMIPAGQSTVIATEINAGNDVTAIGYRIKSSTPDFADGEQSIIPVLSSISPVIDTMPFYIAPDSTSFEMKLPEMPADAKVTLQFCNNPSWYVVTALPGLRNDESKDALSAAAAIFSAAIAEGILKTDSNIASAIKMWNESDRSDSTLVSMLERNSDLKTILLNCTPWVMDAKSDTERMERLALLFDRATIAETYEKSIRQLSLLEAPRGGWSWMSQVKEPSAWITENILGMMGSLKRLGFMPDNSRLEAMIKRGVGYLDREAGETVKKHPASTDTGYSILRLDYKEIPVPSAAQRLINNTVTEAKSHWKDYGVTSKALAATLLYNHNYKSESRRILASLREYATSTPQKGMWWASLDDLTAWSMGKIGATTIILDAFNTIEPQSPDVELIRQWLILQKEAKNWGTSVTTSDAVAAILLSGKRLTAPAEPPVIKIGDKTVTPDSIDSLLGYFRRDISDLMPAGATLSVDKQEGLPSWGAVFCQYNSEMTEIKAASCDDVSIDKHLFVKSVDGDKTVWTDADTIKTGDVVQVNLTIITKRDMDYVAIIDERGACFEPVEQLPQPLYAEGICFYRENRDAATNIFVTHLPKGTYRLSYELFVNNQGVYSAGIASIQSQYAPALSAHSAGSTINVK